MSGSRSIGPPPFEDVVSILRVFVDVSRSDPWFEALQSQVDAVVGVTGTFWYADLILDGDCLPMPSGTQIPLRRELITRSGIEPPGSLLLWSESRTGVIDCVEFAVVEKELVKKYPTADEGEEWI